ncbi:gastrula zinc finger protein XlCGF28.1-like [Silurus meridionalis]|nr:gastrula zinc finger protein XlCGF28.1-like [Silurus meridionalis]
MEMTELEPVLDFASSGRSGRRNALPDILGSPAGVPPDLSLKLAELSLTGQGRKTILDACDLRALRRHCITYWNATVMEITKWAQEYFQKTLSVNTIHHAIRHYGLKLYRRTFSDQSLLNTNLCGDHQKHQIPWGSPGGKNHLVPQHQLHNKESPALFEKAEKGPTSITYPHKILQKDQRILSSCITSWFGNCIISDRKTLQRIARTAEKIIEVSFPFFMDIYTTRCIGKANSIVADRQPSHTLITLLPPRKRY